MVYRFDYESKVWGGTIPSKSPFSLAGLRFYYFLKSIYGKYGKVLEIGCGAGGNLQGLHRYRPYLSLYGVDISAAAIEYGKLRFPGLTLERAAAEQLPFDDESFDIVCFFDVLEHVVDPLICMREAARVLKAGGVMHAYIPCEGELFSLHGLLNSAGINLKEKTAGHIQKLTKKDVVGFCEASGLRVIETKWSCHLINQIGDLAYYLYLTISGKRLSGSLESELDGGSPVGGVLVIIKSIVASIWYWESRLLWFVPGAGLHITCAKDK